MAYYDLEEFDFSGTGLDDYVVCGNEQAILT